MTKNISKDIIVKYTVSEMHALVANFPRYKDFLPWCSDSKIISQGSDYIVGRIDIRYMLVNIHFTTKNITLSENRIEMHLVDGPFKNMNGCWEFLPEANGDCRLKFNLDYQFNNFIAEMALGKVFSLVISGIIDSFIAEAISVYGVRA